MFFQKLIVGAVSAGVLALSAASYAQQAPVPAQQAPVQPAPTQVMPVPAQPAPEEVIPVPQAQPQINPAALFIQKMASMDSQQFGKFPVSQKEIDQASEFLMTQAKNSGDDMSRDQALLTLGYISGQLGVFEELRQQVLAQQAEQQGALPPMMPAPAAPEGMPVQPIQQPDVQPAQPVPAPQTAPQTAPQAAAAQ